MKSPYNPPSDMGSSVVLDGTHLLGMEVPEAIILGRLLGYCPSFLASLVVGIGIATIYPPYITHGRRIVLGPAF